MGSGTVFVVIADNEDCISSARALGMDVVVVVSVFLPGLSIFSFFFLLVMFS
jgi:dethiobiotin synthetase